MAGGNVGNFSDVTVIIPTINEEKTLGRVIGYLLRACKGIRILVADDGSIDGTKGVAASFGKKVLFIDRKKLGLEKGLTASVMTGIERSKTRFVVVMDADMQHPPEKIKEIVLKLRAGSDIVVGVRERVEDWELGRKIISKLMIWFGGAVLTLRNSETCGDIFSGFFGARRSVVSKAMDNNGRRFIGKGYKVLYDFLKCNRRGSLRIAEVPYTFRGRKFGRSKAGLEQGLALLRSFFS